MAETVVPAPISGEHPGREQPINIGSAGIAAHSASLEPTDGVAFAAWLLPTLPARGREQGIAAKWSPERKTGFALLLDADGRLVFRVGDGDVSEIATDEPVKAGRWLHVAANDAQTGRALWQVEASAEIGAADRNAILPCLIAAAKPLLDPRSSAVEQTAIGQAAAEVRALREG